MGPRRRKAKGGVDYDKVPVLRPQGWADVRKELPGLAANLWKEHGHAAVKAGIDWAIPKAIKATMTPEMRQYADSVDLYRSLTGKHFGQGLRRTRRN